MGFSRQEYWSGLPFLSPGDLPDPCLLCLLIGRQILYHQDHLESPGVYSTLCEMPGWMDHKLE